MMEWLFASGHAADVVLVVLGLEALVLARMGRGWREIATMLGPAVLMMLALRGALTGMDWPWIAVPLALAFPLHLADVRRRRR